MSECVDMPLRDQPMTQYFEVGRSPSSKAGRADRLKDYPLKSRAVSRHWSDSNHVSHYSA